jgi:hypothetical protein
MILGTVLLVLVVGSAVVSAWKYRSAVLGNEDEKRPALSDEMLIALARKRDAELTDGDRS